MSTTSKSGMRRPQRNSPAYTQGSTRSTVIGMSLSMFLVAALLGTTALLFDWGTVRWVILGMCCVLALAGVGLLRSREWARIVGAFAFPILVSGIRHGEPRPLLLPGVLFAAAGVYLLLPSTKRSLETLRGEASTERGTD